MVRLSLVEADKSDEVIDRSDARPGRPLDPSRLGDC